MSDSSQNQRPSHTKPVSPRTTSGLQERDEDSERAAPHRAPRSPATGPHSPGPGKQALTSGPLSRRGPASTEQPKLAGSHAGNQDAVSGDNRPQGCPSPCKHPTGLKLARQPGQGPPPNRLPAQHGRGVGWGGSPAAAGGNAGHQQRASCRHGCSRGRGWEDQGGGLCPQHPGREEPQSGAHTCPGAAAARAPPPSPESPAGPCPDPGPWPMANRALTGCLLGEQATTPVPCPPRIMRACVNTHAQTHVRTHTGARGGWGGG